MSQFADKLKRIREESGFRSALAFYRKLSSSAELNFNYQYYVKIESGKVLPSHAVAELIASLIGGENGDQLVLSYCKTIFSKREHLFRSTCSAPPRKRTSTTTGQRYTVRDAKVLSIAQVARICESRDHYYLFLLLTLARNPIRTEDFARYFDDLTSVERKIEALAEKKICERTPTGWASTSTEHKFPSPDNEQVKSLYARMDPWDRDFDKFFGFGKEYYKFLLRRVSARHLAIALNHCQLLTDLLLSAEEVDPFLNNETIFFELRLTRGSLPG